MAAARPVPTLGQTSPISRKQWLWVIVLVLVAHWISLGHNWGLGPAQKEEDHYLAIDLRPIELVDQAPGPKAPSTLKPKSPGKAKPAISNDSDATPAAAAQFEPPAAPTPIAASEPSPVAATVAPEAAASSALASPPSGPAVTVGAQPAPSKTSGENVSSTLATSLEGAEKVTLTVPKNVKLPDSRNWTFITTHKSAKVYAPNLATDFRWKVENGQYEVYLGAGALYAPFTKLARQSKGTLSERGLQPTEFIATQRDGTRTVSYFDQPNQRVTFGAPGRPPKALLTGAQDELSAAVQLATMFLGEPQRYTAGERIVMPVVQRTDAQIWIFKVEGEDQIEIPRGPIRTVKLSRAPRSEFDTAVTVWLAPDQQYMPVRLRLDYSADRSDDMLWKGF